MRRKTHVSQVVLPDLSRLHVSRPVGMDAPPDAKRPAMQDEPPSDRQPLQLPEDLLLKVFTMVLEDSETDPAPADPAPAESGSVSADPVEVCHWLRTHVEQIKKNEFFDLRYKSGDALWRAAFTLCFGLQTAGMAPSVFGFQNELMLLNTTPKARDSWTFVFMLLCNEIKRLEESDLVFLDSKLPLDIRDRFDWRTFKTWDKWRCNSIHALLHRQDVELHMTDPQSPTKPTFPFLLRLLSLTGKTDRMHDGPMTGPALEDLESAVFKKYQEFKNIFIDDQEQLDMEKSELLIEWFGENMAPEGLFESFDARYAVWPVDENQVLQLTGSARSPVDGLVETITDQLLVDVVLPLENNLTVELLRDATDFMRMLLDEGKVPLQQAFNVIFDMGTVLPEEKLKLLLAAAIVSGARIGEGSFFRSYSAKSPDGKLTPLAWSHAHTYHRPSLQLVSRRTTVLSELIKLPTRKTERSRPIDIYSTVEFLLENRADIDGDPGRVGKAPLLDAIEMAAENGDFNVAHLLITSGAKVNLGQHSEAARAGKIDASNPWKQPLVEAAAIEPWFEATPYRPYWPNPRDAPPIDIYDDVYSLVKKLVQFKADVNARDGRGRTALQAAVMATNARVVEYLLEEGALLPEVETVRTATDTETGQIVRTTKTEYSTFEADRDRLRSARSGLLTALDFASRAGRRRAAELSDLQKIGEMLSAAKALQEGRDPEPPPPPPRPRWYRAYRAVVETFFPQDDPEAMETSS